MTITYTNFMKHAQYVTKSANKQRPVLQGVMHREGNLIVTDAHRLYVAKNIYEGTDKNINPKTGDLIEGNYPEIDRLIPHDADAKLSVLIYPDVLHKALKVISDAGKIGKASDTVDITLANNVLTFSTGKNALVRASFTIDSPTKADNFTMTANAAYVTQALALVKDTGDIGTFNFYGTLRPFTLTSDNVMVLILPVRVY